MGLSQRLWGCAPGWYEAAPLALSLEEGFDKR